MHLYLSDAHVHARLPRYQDFGGARFQQVVRDRSAAGAGASHQGGGTAGGTRRSVPMSGGGGDGYGYGYGGCSEEDDRGMAGDGDPRQHGGHRGGGGHNSEASRMNGRCG